MVIYGIVFSVLPGLCIKTWILKICTFLQKCHFCVENSLAWVIISLNLSSAYVKTHAPLIHNFSLTVWEGKTVLIILFYSKGVPMALNHFYSPFLCWGC